MVMAVLAVSQLDECWQLNLKTMDQVSRAVGVSTIGMKGGK